MRVSMRASVRARRTAGRGGGQASAGVPARMHGCAGAQVRGCAGAGAHRRSPPKPAAANLGRRAGARAARSRRSVTWRQSAVTVTTGNAFAERFAGIGEGWRVRRRRKRAGRAEFGAPRATAAENTARGLSRLATDPAEGASLGGRRSHLRTSRTPPAISDPHATIGSDGRPDGLGREMGSQGYMHGIGEYLGAVRLAQNGSRLRSGPPFGRT